MPHIKAKYLEPQHGTGYHGSFNAIADGAVAANDIVIASGYDGNRVKFRKADANVDLYDVGVMGVADHAAATGASVRVVSHKLITSVDSSASEGAGDPVYLSDTAGSWSATAGTAPVIVGTVLSDHASTGAVLLAPASVAQRSHPNATTMAAAASATTTLTAADSGKTVLMAPNAAIVTLPSPVVGLTFKIIQTGAYDTGVSAVKLPTTDGSVFFVGGHAASDSNDGAASDNDSNDVINFGSATVAGDFVEVTCISSTQWAVTGFSKAGSNGVAYADS